ncbi:hypothetical protein LTR35_004494 [Friedmanniomyces endolithicus]|uniref:Zn(2)-C6 fungal-type domain-containing protein n=1 Tax=Friedmanniomyces endolithicus TaxID=329885 RepID=A0AAN6FY22_9PEZI|nr:hypothetical protein LTR35_004494 [Friedmanniomyces endolithicus]KAK0295620.1 hypothetical protein LTS00_005821 [Friedmanniomyces endolithicus]KAK0326421.1 hypothetical protein LTR82_002262 [Friedmanniomyces endolithicus]KAK0993356.1 hypothetical protein LTR54_011127 [Friedmanniomyces endolithicus]
MNPNVPSAPPTAPTSLSRTPRNPRDPRNLEPNTASNSKRDNHTPSCAICQRRKVKCNRVWPCGPCQTTGLECEFRAVNPHGRKRARRSLGEGSELTDQHLWAAGASPGEVDVGGAGTAGGTPGAGRGIDSGFGRGVLGDSIGETEIAVGTPNSDNNYHRDRHIIFNRDQTAPLLPQPVQPPANHVVQLWQTYLTNVDPIWKIVHAPTLQQTVLGQIGKSDIPPSMQVLTSAILFVSAVSLQDDECEALLQTSRADLINGYRQATKDTLSAAAFVTTTDLAVLQAFVIYLVALLSLGETSFVWSMTGLAIRIAGTLNLTQDGSKLNLPPFESEMRRRLWWALLYLEARTSELVGQNGGSLAQHHDVHLPANLNDSELFPDMQHLPESRPDATEMVYVLLKTTGLSILSGPPYTGSRAETWRKLHSTSVPTSEKADIVEALEHRIQENILRFCDLTIPLQALTLNSAQTFPTKMRLIANIPHRRDELHLPSSNGYSEDLFQLSLKLMRLQLDLFTNPSLRKWKWHWKGDFQWYALAELVRQTRLLTPGAESREAWMLVQEVFDKVVPALEVAPVKCRLLGALRGLLQRHGPRALTAGDAQSAVSSIVDGTPDDAITTSTSGRGRVWQFSTGLGSRPHSALLPGMDSLPTPATAREETVGSGAGLDETAMATDLDAIDWAEFDRLTSELCE